jgi:Protease subunit of ATP-dependent Clp proteases
MDRTKQAANPGRSLGRTSDKHFWNWVKDEELDARTLYLDGTIADESWWDDEITPRMFKDELLSGNGDIVVWINSPGGDCVAASQIYAMLMDYKGKVTVKIDGIAASAASVIAMAGTEVLMAPTAILMVHNPLTVAIGDTKEYKSMRKQIQEKLIKFATRVPVFMYLTDYCERSLKDVITQLEPGLFKKVTGLNVKDFELLCSIGVFNANLNLM